MSEGSGAATNEATRARAQTREGCNWHTNYCQQESPLSNQGWQQWTHSSQHSRSILPLWDLSMEPMQQPCRKSALGYEAMVLAFQYWQCRVYPKTILLSRAMIKYQTFASEYSRYQTILIKCRCLLMPGVYSEKPLLARMSRLGCWRFGHTVLIFYHIFKLQSLARYWIRSAAHRI
jgi:hypothetical protein